MLPPVAGAGQFVAVVVMTNGAPVCQLPSTSEVARSKDPVAPSGRLVAPIQTTSGFVASQLMLSLTAAGVVAKLPVIVRACVIGAVICALAMAHPPVSPLQAVKCQFVLAAAVIVTLLVDGFQPGAPPLKLSVPLPFVVVASQ